GIEVERDEQGPVGWRGGGRGGGSPPPGIERGRGDPLTRAELGDRQTADGLSPEGSAPGGFETEGFGAGHGVTPGLEERDQPSRVAAVARLVLPCAYEFLRPLVVRRLAASENPIERGALAGMSPRGGLGSRGRT